MAATTRIYTLEACRAYRAGSRDGTCDLWIRSDTLMAALHYTAVETGLFAGALEGGILPFQVSSLFCEAGGIRLFPRPLPAPVDTSGGTEDAEWVRRSWRRVRWISEKRLEALCEGRRVRYPPRWIIEGELQQDVWALESELNTIRGLPQRSLRRGILVDRKGGREMSFLTQLVKVPEAVRLFFLARLEDETVKGELDELVSLLGEAGLGGKRSSGVGQFRLVSSRPPPSFLADSGNKTGNKSRTDPPEGEHTENSDPAGEGAGTEEAPSPTERLLLSLYLPTRDEVERGVLDGVPVETVVRGGWIHSKGVTAFRKRPVRMLAEGTVLPAIPQAVEGEVRNVAPLPFKDHPVWRDGRAFTVRYRGPRVKV